MTTSKLAINRQEGKNQVESQRARILSAAETLFLTKGIENTGMSDIAEGAGINRVSLYRYYPDRHRIAFELAALKMKQIVGTIDLTSGDEARTLEQGLLRLVDSFYELRDAYRYLGMFDHLYGSQYPNEELAAWYKQEIFALGWGQVLMRGSSETMDVARIAMLSNCTLSFLQKLAARGDLLAGEQEVPLDEQLKAYKEMVISYLGK